MRKSVSAFRENIAVCSSLREAGDDLGIGVDHVRVGAVHAVDRPVGAEDDALRPEDLDRRRAPRAGCSRPSSSGSPMPRPEIFMWIVGDLGQLAASPPATSGNRRRRAACGKAQWSTQTMTSRAALFASAASFGRALEPRIDAGDEVVLGQELGSRAARRDRRGSRPAPKSRMPRTFVYCRCRSSTASASGRARWTLGDDALRVAGLVGDRLQPRASRRPGRACRPPPRRGSPSARSRSGSRRCSP